MNKKNISKYNYLVRMRGFFRNVGFLLLSVLLLLLSACSDVYKEGNKDPDCVSLEKPSEDGSYNVKNDVFYNSEDETSKGDRPSLIASRCGNNDDSTEKKTESPVDVDTIEKNAAVDNSVADPVDDVPQLDLVIETFEIERINQEVFLSQVHAGDVVVVQIMSGTQKRQRFSSLYEKTVDVYWNDERCIDFSKMGPKPCYDIPMKGTCQLFYRDYLGEFEVPIEIKGKPLESPESIPLNLRIGRHSYYFDEFSSQEDSVNVSFQISPEMVRDTKDLYLTPVTDFKGDVTVGFVNAEQCPHKDKKDFNFGDAGLSTIISDSVKRDFEVSLKIIRWEKEVEKDSARSLKDGGEENGS